MKTSNRVVHFAPLITSIASWSIPMGFGLRSDAFGRGFENGAQTAALEQLRYLVRAFPMQRDRRAIGQLFREARNEIRARRAAARAQEAA